jgi:dephospho-CoA kinase
MLIIGLTGGIGCGKTTVTQFFEKRNVPVIDADEIAHAIVQTGQPALALLEKAFGQQILSADGSLNRTTLREHVFNHPSDKKKLENILHPIIYKTMFQKITEQDTPYGILSIPLLFETNHQDKVDRVLLIDCPEATQIARVKSRDQHSDSMISSIMRSQCSRVFRQTHSDDIITNNGSLQALESEVQKMHNFYIEMSAGKISKHPAK